MDLKQCPQCRRYSVSFDSNRRVETCRWRDCNWVNVGHKELPVAHRTILTSRANHTGKDPSAAAEERLPA